MDTAATAESHIPHEIPFYEPVGNECQLFERAYQQRLPLLLKGPTGCGKTRFVSHMAAKLGRPLFTVSCHDDLTAADLTGRYLLQGGETRWVDGPLTQAVREGGICYLDEVVEARKDVTVVLHPLTDDRRLLPLERTGELLEAPDDFITRVTNTYSSHSSPVPGSVLSPRVLTFLRRNWSAILSPPKAGWLHSSALRWSTLQLACGK